LWSFITTTYSWLRRLLGLDCENQGPGFAFLNVFCNGFKHQLVVHLAAGELGPAAHACLVLWMRARTAMAGCAVRLQTHFGIRCAAWLDAGTTRMLGFKTGAHSPCGLNLNCGPPSS
jgi:hypothetical protein